MGNYVYKVTAKRIKLTDGSFANLAVFAYKDHFWDQKLVARMRKDSACHVAERFVTGSKFTGKVVIGSLADDGKTAVVSRVARAVSHGTFGDNEYDRYSVVGDVAMLDTEKDIAKVF